MVATGIVSVKRRALGVKSQDVMLHTCAVDFPFPIGQPGCRKGPPQGGKVVNQSETLETNKLTDPPGRA
jgi:hypothetical protein